MRTTRALTDCPSVRLIVINRTGGLTRLRTLYRRLTLAGISLLPFIPHRTLPSVLTTTSIALVLRGHKIINFGVPSGARMLLTDNHPVVTSIPRRKSSTRTVQTDKNKLIMRPRRPSTLTRNVLSLCRRPRQTRRLTLRKQHCTLRRCSFGHTLSHCRSLFCALTASHQVIRRPTGTTLTFKSDRG